MEEVIDIDTLGDFGGSGSNTPQRSVNFGGGLEFLMNDRKRSSSAAKTQIDLAELDNLENELNDLGAGGGESRPLRGLFDYGAPVEDDVGAESIHLGNSTFEAAGGGSSRTWDGFSKMNLDAPAAAGEDRASANLTANEKRRKKRAMLKKINEWADKGIIKHNPNYTMDTPFEEVEDEYETCLDDKRKKDSVKLYGWWFMTFVNTVEYANTAMNPFDLNLDGWGEQVSDDIESYEEIFGELHEKYKGGKMAPELSLLLRLGFSAAMVNFTNKALSTATPGFNDVIRQSPELMKLFTNATVETMSKQSPAMGFMSNMMSGVGSGGAAPAEPTPNMGYGRPPAPVETQGPRAAAPPTRPGQMAFSPNLNARPDLAAASASRTPMFREQGVSLDGAERVNIQERTPIRRGEMSGPSIEIGGGGGGGIDSILAGLKPKNVNIQRQEDDSMVSISSLKELQGNTTVPKSSRRRAAGANRGSRSENTISLDI